MLEQPRALRVNGAVLHYVAHGAGAPVVFVHGGLGDYRSWAGQLPAFAAHYRVVAYSRRYHFPDPGAGEAGGYTTAGHAADLAALIGALDLGAVHLVAESYGAAVALLCAHQWPPLVRTLVLGEPPLLPWLEALPGGGPLLAEYLATTIRPAIQASREGELERAVALFFDGTVGPAGAFARLPPSIRDLLLDNASALRLELLSVPTDWSRAKADYFGPFTPADAAGIGCPTLLLEGERSPALFRLITDELARRLSASTRVLIPRAAHALAMSQPAAYNKAILAFLTAH